MRDEAMEPGAEAVLTRGFEPSPVRDDLTGLFNSRYLEETLDREVHRASRTEQPLCVMAVDVDGFTSVNDARGREAGDRALQTVAGILRSHVREEDVAARFGGDEFVLVLPGAAWDVARHRAEKIREEIKQSAGDPASGQLTVSIGLAMFPENGSTADELVAAAFRALAHAGGAGGDQVRSATLD